ncbi:MAG: hypothetical protein ACKO96_44445, partial [Flammeovirgaceae bacterium]
DMQRRAANVDSGSYLDIYGNVNRKGVGTTPEWNPSMGQFRNAYGSGEELLYGAFNDSKNRQPW